jgi:hypothetical protein
VIARFATGAVGPFARIHVRDGDEDAKIRAGLLEVTARRAAGGEPQ